MKKDKFLLLISMVTLLCYIPGKIIAQPYLDILYSLCHSNFIISNATMPAVSVRKRDSPRETEVYLWS